MKAPTALDIQTQLLNALLSECGLTPVSAARLLQVKHAQVKNWLYGRAIVPKEVLRRLEAYRTAARRIFSGPIPDLKTRAVIKLPKEEPPPPPPPEQHYLCHHKQSDQVYTFAVTARSHEDAIAQYKEVIAAPFTIGPSALKRIGKYKTQTQVCFCGALYQARPWKVAHGQSMSCSVTCSNRLMAINKKVKPDE